MIQIYEHGYRRYFQMLVLSWALGHVLNWATNKIWVEKGRSSLWFTCLVLFCTNVRCRCYLGPIYDLRARIFTLAINATRHKEGRDDPFTFCLRHFGLLLKTYPCPPNLLKHSPNLRCGLTRSLAIINMLRRSTLTFMLHRTQRPMVVVDPI